MNDGEYTALELDTHTEREGEFQICTETKKDLGLQGEGDGIDIDWDAKNNK